jgi:DNA gyrase subunit A
MGDEDVVLTTSLGKTIRFEQSQVRSMGRPASGVRGINLRPEDEVISMDIISASQAKTAQLITISRHGKGKRTPAALYPRKGRGTQGVISMVLGADDSIALARVIDFEMLLTFITSNGIVLKTQAGEIRLCGRSAQGVKVLSLDENDTVVAMAADDPEDENQKQKRILDVGDMIGVDMFESGDDDDDTPAGDDE